MMFLLLTAGAVGACVLLTLALFFLVAEIFMTAAPFALAAMIGLSAQRMNGWLLFFIWIVVMYSLSSYPTIRRGIAFASAALLSVFIEMPARMLLRGSLHEGTLGLSIVLMAIMLIFACGSLVADYGKMEPFCFGLNNILYLPPRIQYAIAGACYGFGVTSAFAIGFTDGGLVKSQTGFWFVLIQWVIWIVTGVITYLLQAGLARTNESAAAA